MSVSALKTSRNQDRAIIALLASPTIAEAAAAAGVTERTLFRWLQDPGFQEAYRGARREAVSHAMASLQRATRDAVKALTSVMNRRRNPPSARVAAAKAVLELAVKGMELEDLEARISALEKLAEERKD